LGGPLGEQRFQQHFRTNPELRLWPLRGYPDWVEEIEVDSDLPLDAYELRLYYLRFDREVAFTSAYLLGRPHVSLRLFERPIAAADRARIEEAYLAADPARRSELADDRAMAAAEQAERVRSRSSVWPIRPSSSVTRMERDFHRRLRK
jgi:hypothetical protein